MKLLVDDESEILTLYKTFLESRGKEIVTATDGVKCVETHKREFQKTGNYFDVIILDQKMPIMTGLEAAVEILRINSQQKIIFASGYLEKTLLMYINKIKQSHRSN